MLHFLEFRYFFTSKELPSFGGRKYNDIVKLYYNIPDGLAQSQWERYNYAGLFKGDITNGGSDPTATSKPAGQATVVSINNLAASPTSPNSEYLVENFFPGSEFTPRSFFNFPAFSKALQFRAPLDCTRENVVNITIEDVGDGDFDSAVFIDTDSVTIESICPIQNTVWGPCDRTCCNTIGANPEPTNCGTQRIVAGQNVGQTRSCSPPACAAEPVWGACNRVCCNAWEAPNCGVETFGNTGRTRACLLQPPQCAPAVTWGTCNRVCCNAFEPNCGVETSSIGQQRPCQITPPTCKSAPCLFRLSSYGACTGERGKTCGAPGVQTRTVQCFCGDTLSADTQCSDRGNTAKPETARTCQLPVCAKWNTSPWGPCSITCSTALGTSGQQVRAVTCTQGDAGAPVLDGLCAGLEKPSGFQSCTPASECPVYIRAPGNWSSCESPVKAPGTDEPCGPGTRTRAMKCVDQKTGKEALGGVVTDAFGQPVFQDPCAGLPMPQTQEGCSNKPCGVCDYKVESWGECSTTCDSAGNLGVMKRKVYCQDRDGKEIADACCKAQKVEDGATSGGREPTLISMPLPVDSARCPQLPCPTYSFRVGNWGACSVTCGAGAKERPVNCILDDEVVEDGKCDSGRGLDRPATREACQLPNCMCKRAGVTDFSTCSTTCGQGVQERKVYCEEYPCNARTGQNYYVKRSVGTLAEIEEKCPDAVRELDQSLLSEKKDCEMQKCMKYGFKLKPVGECSATCGQGSRTQVAECFDTELDTKVAMANCLLAGVDVPNDPPPVVCELPDCSAFTWRPEAWSACTNERGCGTGVHTRNVPCLETLEGKSVEVTVPTCKLPSGTVDTGFRGGCPCGLNVKPPEVESCLVGKECEQVVTMASDWCTSSKMPCYKDFGDMGGRELEINYRRIVTCKELKTDRVVDNVQCGNPLSQLSCDQEKRNVTVCGCCPRTESPTAAPTALPTLEPTRAPTTPAPVRVCNRPIEQFTRTQSATFCTNMKFRVSEWTSSNCDRDCENNFQEMAGIYGGCCFKHIVMDKYNISDAAARQLFGACWPGRDELDLSCSTSAPLAPRPPPAPAFNPPQQRSAPIFNPPPVFNPPVFNPPVFFTAPPVFQPPPATLPPFANVPCDSVGSVLSTYGLSTAQRYLTIAPSVQQDLTGSFTLFAPTNRALEELQIPNGVTPSQFIARVLRTHIIRAARPTSTFNYGDAVVNVNNQALDLSRTLSGSVTLNQVCLQGGSCARVSIADVNVCNGVLHVIDKVLA